MKIAVAGIGYVGLGNAAVLARHHEVVMLDIDEERVAQVNALVSPLEEAELTRFLSTEGLSLSATSDVAVAFKGADMVIIATPTDYDPDAELLRHLYRGERRHADVARLAPEATVIVIKSTIPVGFTDRPARRHPGLRQYHLLPGVPARGQGAATTTSIPSRIVVGERSARGGAVRRAAAQAGRA
ncbi:MAG: 3-hydroxyacyl-CoA dehydrogenase NAD-binding domain-containing protein [Dermatophilaceae bacterium]